MHLDPIACNVQIKNLAHVQEVCFPPKLGAMCSKFSLFLIHLNLICTFHEGGNWVRCINKGDLTSNY